MQSMVEATNAFIKRADYLTPDDEAAVTALTHTAAALDDKFTASLMAQWRGIYTELRNRKQDGPVEEVSEDEQALRDLGL